MWFYFLIFNPNIITYSTPKYLTLSGVDYFNKIMILSYSELDKYIYISIYIFFISSYGSLMEELIITEFWLISFLPSPLPSFLPSLPEHILYSVRSCSSYWGYRGEQGRHDPWPHGGCSWDGADCGGWETDSKPLIMPTINYNVYQCCVEK